MAEATTAACAEALLSGWVSRFGVPDDMTSDRGPSFMSELWSSLARLMGTTIHHTTAYNPAANGMVERSHRSLKAALMARCTGGDWKAQLPWVLLGLRTAPKEDLQASPAEMVFGETVAVPGEFFPQTQGQETPEDLKHLRLKVGRFRPCIQTYKDTTKRYMPKALEDCRFVFVRDDAHRIPLTRPYHGPYLVLQRSPKAYLLSVCGRQDWVSIDRLKPAFLEEDASFIHMQNRSAKRVRAPPGQRGDKVKATSTQRKSSLDHRADESQTFSKSGRLIRPPDRLGFPASHH